MKTEHEPATWCVLACFLVLLAVLLPLTIAGVDRLGEGVVHIGLYCALVVCVTFILFRRSRDIQPSEAIIFTALLRASSKERNASLDVKK